MKTRILVVDDDADVLALLHDVLAQDGHEVAVAGSAAALRDLLAKRPVDVVLLDWRLPDGDGIQLVPELKQQWPETEVIVLTAYGTFDAAVDATKAGAFHFASKPIQVEGLRVLVRRACEHKQLREQAAALQQVVSTLSGGASPVFKSPAMKHLLRIVERVARSEAPVFITGESGTGKEIIADLVHGLSDRAKGPFIKVNCAALPRELIESELFGSVKGAYTGAHADREGLFSQAHGGTVLLDEISEMPLDTQSKLLRVLQEKEMRPVGSMTSYLVDCRIIASTNRSVEEALQGRKLREDLYYRISTITLHLPPLRDRREDIVPLALAFLRRFAAQAGRSLRGFTPQALECLQRFDWPGNVRQLENEVQRAVLVCDGAEIDVTDLSMGWAQTGAEPEPVTGLAAMERTAILGALQQTGGNKAAAARQLGITRQTLYNKLRQFGLDATP